MPSTGYCVLQEYFLVLHANKSCQLSTEILYPYDTRSMFTRFLSKYCTRQNTSAKWHWAIFKQLGDNTITTFIHNILSKSKIILSNTMGKFACVACRKVCKSAYGLRRHIQANKLCQDTSNALTDFENLGIADNNSDLDENDETNVPPKKRQLLDAFNEQVEDDHLARQKLVAQNKIDQEGEEADQEAVEEIRAQMKDYHEDFFFDPFAEASSSEDGGVDNQEEEDDDEEDDDENNDEMQANQVQGEASNESVKEFKAFARHAYQHFGDLEDEEKAAIRIMRTLQKKKAPLDTYDSVMEWYLIESGKLRRGAPLGKSPFFVSRKKLMKKLRKRYNMEHKYAKPVKTILPYSATKLDVFCHNARDCVQSLLTDPRWEDKDWLYFNDDPFAPPPDDLPYYGDVNTGQAYLATYKKLIKKPNQILVGLPLYIDGAVTGQYDKLQVTALKMSLCILNRKARDKEFAWRTLGFVTNYTKEDSRGKKQFVESGHIAAFEMATEELTDEEEGANTKASSEQNKAADYHAIIAVILESLFALVKEGMVFDIHYKGQLHKNCELVFFIPFVKCDGDEGDKLCGHYRSRTKGVKQLCRYCTCPNGQTDDPQANFSFKTEPMLNKLFEQNNAERLADLSQILMKNAFHGLRFGLHNDRGIHGATPWELLHAILLGIFKYCRDCFFAQMGPTSATAEEINSLAKMIGALFARQSDRDRPRTKFAKGIMKGKIMAKEFTGVMLVMAAILRMRAGQTLLKRARKKNFREDWNIRDWILLVETLLQWEAYLCLDQMQKKHVTRLQQKNRFVMFLLKKVGNRTKGMGFRVMKFHAILHLYLDIQMFGVPMNVDTGSNESHHKSTKIAAKLTQKDITTFEKQTSDRCDDFQVLDMALEEIDGRPLWDYFVGYDRIKKATKEPENSIGGMMYIVYADADTKNVDFEIKTRMKNKNKVRLDVDLLGYIIRLQTLLVRAGHDEFVKVFSQYNRGEEIFRAHPNFRGKGLWRDWVMIQWNQGDYPAQIWGFLDLTHIPESVGDQNLVFGGDIPSANVGHGYYAIVESTTYIEEDQPQSDIFTPLDLEVSELTPNGQVLRRKFYVVDVKCFKEAIVVIPDIGSQPACQYLMMKARKNWSTDFIAWLEMPHKWDKIEMLPPPEEGEEYDGEEAD